MDCKAARENLAFFLDGELGAEVLSGIRLHLGFCLPCRERAEFERTFTRAFRERARGKVPSPHLEQRIRFALARASRPSYASILSSPTARWAMAAGLVMALSLGIAQSCVHEGGTLHNLLIPAVRTTELHGTIVCLGCESQKGHDPAFHDHQNVIRTGNGALWTIIESPSTREMIHDETLIGQEARVRGTFYRRTHAVSIASVQYI